MNTLGGGPKNNLKGEDSGIEKSTDLGNTSADGYGSHSEQMNGGKPKGDDPDGPIDKIEKTSSQVMGGGPSKRDLFRRVNSNTVAATGLVIGRTNS